MRNTSSSARGACTQYDLFQPAGGSSPTVWAAQVGGGVVNYSVHRSLRAKRVILKVSPRSGLQVVVPARMKLAGLEGIISSKSGWISKHLGLVRQKAREQRLSDGATVPYMGGRLTLSVSVERGSSPHARHSEGTLLVSVPDRGERSIREAVTAWYKAKARRIIPARVERLRGRARVNRVSVKDQKTRWGSCSSRGNLNFNWRLVMAPPRVMDYLIIHELAHLKRPDHSSGFWGLVASKCPDYEAREAWLKENAGLLALW